VRASTAVVGRPHRLRVFSVDASLFHASAVSTANMDKFKLAHKYHGLEKNVWLVHCPFAEAERS
jgi:hypothetical protein